MIDDQAPGIPGYNPTVRQVPEPDSLPGPDSETSAYVPKSSQSSGFEGSIVQLMSLLASSQLPGGPPVVEGYKLLQLEGRGGFGCVWQAQDTTTDEIVAIKFLVRQSRDTSGILEEVKHLASVQGCFGVVPVKSVREQGTPPHYVPYYVMQYAPGGSIQKLIDKDGKLDAGQTVRLIKPVVKALAFIHARQVVHSDLKPANILLNEAGEPLIADFGQAQRNSQSSGQGTFFYMAPERATIEKLRPDPRWDVYSLGAMLYSMLTGDLPRKTKGLTEAMSSAPYEERLRLYREGLMKAPTPTEHRKYCDKDLARIIDRCLNIDPEQRPNNAGDVRQLFERRSFLRRMKPLVRLGVTATIGLLALVPTVGYLYGRSRINDEKKNITSKIVRALDKTSNFGKAIMEEKIADRVNFVEYHANDDKRCPYQVRSILEKIGHRIGDQIAGKDFANPQAKVADKDREFIDAWLEKDVYSVLARRHPASRKSLAVHVAVENPEAPGTYRSYLVSRIEGADGEGKPAEISPRQDRLKQKHLYETNWSYRDYFNGAGNAFKDFKTDKLRSYPVINSTHISHTYLSRAGVTKDGKAIYPWKIDVSTPIWTEETVQVNGEWKPRRKVVALLVCGIFVDQDLQSIFHSPESHVENELVTEYVVVNERKSWVLHEHYRSTLTNPENTEQVRDPESYDVLHERKRSRLPAGCVTFCSIPAAATAGAAKTSSHEYVDLVKTDDAGNGPVEIASYAHFQPFRESIYPELRSSQKKWTFIAQVERDKALMQVDAIRREVLTAALIVIFCLLAIVVVLWVWLIRLVNRAEFAGNG